MSKWTIIQIEESGTVREWAKSDSNCETFELIKYFMGMNNPEEFFLINNEKDRMINLVQAYLKLRAAGGYQE